MIALPRVHHRRIDVDGVEVFYRESVPDYEHGVADPTLIAPDGWTLDQHFLDRLPA